MAVDSACTKHLPSLKFIGDALTFSALIGRMTLILTWCPLLPLMWTTFLPILVFLGLFVLDLWANTCQTDHVDFATLTINLGGHGACQWCGFSCSVCTKFEVRRLSHSEDIAHLLCEH